MGYCSSWCWCQAWVHRSTLSIFCSDTMCLAKSQSFHANMCSEESTHESSGRQIKTSRKVFDGWTASDIAVGMLSNMLWDASVGALSWFSAQCKALALPSGNISTLLSVRSCMWSAGWVKCHPLIWDNGRVSQRANWRSSFQREKDAVLSHPQSEWPECWL